MSTELSTKTFPEVWAQPAPHLCFYIFSIKKNQGSFRKSLIPDQGKYRMSLKCHLPESKKVSKERRDISKGVPAGQIRKKLNIEINLEGRKGYKGTKR